MGDDKDREVLISLTRACLSSSSGNGAQPHTPQYLLATLMPSPGELQSGICVGAVSSTVKPPCSREDNKGTSKGLERRIFTQLWDNDGFKCQRKAYSLVLGWRWSLSLTPPLQPLRTRAGCSGGVQG